MISHEVRTHPERHRLPQQDQLAFKLAEVAADPVPIAADVADMAANRIIDNAAVAMASIDRAPVATARAQALAHPRPSGASVLGCAPDLTVSAEWAAWANGTAVRELDFHDTFLAADYAHPADSIPALIAVAQQCGRDGAALVRAIAAAYEVHVCLVKGICLHAHKIDHVAHLAPAIAAGLGALLELPVEVTCQAIGQALHVNTATRQSRKGAISSWKAFAPAWAAKSAIEAVDRAMRGEGAPAPIYEGEDGVLAWLLGGPSQSYNLKLPEPGEPKRAILETYTKAHSAEYQSQAPIDLAIRMRPRLLAATGSDWDRIAGITFATSHHTHSVIGTGSNDPQKFDPKASRETLDHSLMYILAVALQDGSWHHVTSYLPERAARPDTVRLWRKIRTREDAYWTDAYHAPDPSRRAFGGQLLVTLDDGAELSDSLAVADAHPAGAMPFGRVEYLRKFDNLVQGRVDGNEAARFLALAETAVDLDVRGVRELTVRCAPDLLKQPPAGGIF